MDSAAPCRLVSCNQPRDSFIIDLATLLHSLFINIHVTVVFASSWQRICMISARKLGVTQCISDKALIAFIILYNVSVSREGIIVTWCMVQFWELADGNIFALLFWCLTVEVNCRC